MNEFYSKYTTNEIYEYFENHFISFKSKYSNKTYRVKYKSGGIMFNNVLVFNWNKKTIKDKNGYEIPEQLEDQLLLIGIQKNHIGPPETLSEIFEVTEKDMNEEIKFFLI